MASTENTSSAPADTAENTATTENQNKPTNNNTENTAFQSETRTTPVRIAESQLEATHSDLPPLSNIPTLSSDSSATASPTGSGVNNRPPQRRGIGRSSAFSTVASQPAIGAVDDPADTEESLSGEFANGYGTANKTPAPAVNNAPGNQNQPREFIPPISQRTVKAEMDPEPERRNREEKRQIRSPRTDDRNRRQQQPRQNESHEGYFNPRNEDRVSSWSPSDSPSSKPRSPRPFNIEAPDIPKQVKDNLWTKIKGFFTDLLNGKSNGQPANKSGTAKSATGKHTADNGNDTGSRDGHYQGRGGRNKRGGDFRHGNRNTGGNPQNYNRDGRHRPHSHGGNNRPRRANGTAPANSGS
ncbi:MAG: hypothetical protein LBS59_04770 [Puniceicoccales bacterium]|jgi:hypothetical protein|nr:hypothetical protein [Puniceicoccales bacterium]